MLGNPQKKMCHKVLALRALDAFAVFLDKNYHYSPGGSGYVLDRRNMIGKKKAPPKRANAQKGPGVKMYLPSRPLSYR